MRFVSRVLTGLLIFLGLFQVIDSGHPHLWSGAHLRHGGGDGPSAGEGAAAPSEILRLFYVLVLRPLLSCTSDEVWTDSLGRYELQSLLYEDEDYFLAVDESTVHRAYRYYKPGQVDTESNRIVRFEGFYEKNYYLTAYGWVRFHILSTDPQSGDLYTFRAGSHYETFSNSVDVYRTFRLRGNQENSLARTLVRDSIYTTVEEHFFVPVFDTIDYEVRI